MRKYLGAVGFVWLIGLIGGCGLPERSVGPSTNVALKLQVGLETPGLARLVDTVTLEIRYDSLTVDTIGLPLDANHEVHTELSVEPGDSVTFTLTAYAINDSAWQKLYEGQSFIPVLGNGERREINIHLLPTVLMLRPSPIYQSVPLGDANAVEIAVWIHEVDSLFGASFRLHWDPAILNLVDVQQGGFLSEQNGTVPTIFFFQTDVAEGAAVCSVTRRRDQDFLPPGRSGSGILARFFFSTVAAGETQITFDSDSRLRPSLKNRDGTDVQGYNDLYLESGTVVVIGGGGR